VEAETIETLTKLYCQHRISRSAEGLWAVLHTPAFEAHLGKAIGLAEYCELERAEDEASIYRRIRVVPSVPAAFRMALRGVGGRGEVGYVEEQWRSKRRMDVRWKMTPFLLADRVRVEGLIRIQPVDDSSCLRILDGEVEVRIPGVGGLIEQAIVSGAVDAYGKSAIAAGSDPREPA
jgi:hypothetical protein